VTRAALLIALLVAASACTDPEPPPGPMRIEADVAGTATVHGLASTTAGHIVWTDDLVEDLELDVADVGGRTAIHLTLGVQVVSDSDADIVLMWSDAIGPLPTELLHAHLLWSGAELALDGVDVTVSASVL
jgi:hypothetical protein